MGSVVGTILDPAADKTLMTTLTVTLAMQGLLPGTLRSSFRVIVACLTFFRTVPLAVIILGRDVLLSLSAFYIRYTSLPEPVSDNSLVPQS
jgi:cardiolipin synthase